MILRTHLIKIIRWIPLLATALIVAKPAFADPPPPDFTQAGGTVSSTVAPYTNLGNLITSLLVAIYYVAGLAFFIYFIVGGVQWITSGGDKAGTEAARNKITNAFIGLVIVVAAYAITLIVGQVLGIRILEGFNFRGPGANP